MLEGLFPVEGVEAYKISVETVAGIKSYKYYDKNTGLLIMQESPAKNPMTGEDMLQAMNFSDYKSVDGIKFPHKMGTSMMAQEIEIVVDSVKINEPLTKADFK